jgi:hypothetical protein
MFNQLSLGDNLEAPRQSGTTFNSQANYKLLFKAHGGQKFEAQMEVVGDTWFWNERTEHARCQPCPLCVIPQFGSYEHTAELRDSPAPRVKRPVVY